MREILSHERLVAAGIAVALSAASLYAAVCTSLCAGGVFPDQPAQVAGQPCHGHHDPQSGDHEHSGGKDCTTHGHLTATYINTEKASGHADLRNVIAGSALLDSVVQLIQRVLNRQIISAHSPPGNVTGRTICQKEVLFRI